MTISLSGMASITALSLIERERDVFEGSIQRDASSKREIAAFKERIGTLENVDDLMKDFEVYSFVLKSFGMGDSLYAKAMNKKIMTSDITDSSSLINRMTQPTAKLLNATMGFEPDGTAPAQFKDPKWVDALVERYIDQRMIDTQREQSETIGVALEFEQKVSGMTSWYKVLADEDVATFMRTALGLPASMATADIDAQARTFAKKMDIADLQDPARQKKLIRQYAAISDANAASANMSTNPVLQLFSSATTSGTWSLATIDVSLVSSFSGNALR